MIRSEIYRDYRRRTYGRYLSKKDVLDKTNKIKFLTDAYYEYRGQQRRYKREHGKVEYCQNKNRYFDPVSEKILTPMHGSLSCLKSDGIS